jgi:ABC-type antimicrobial peptide transport system permease subunit
MIEKKGTPPVFAVWLLSHMMRDEECLSILSDFSEIYEELAGEKGSIRASQWYWSQVLKSIPMFVLKYILWSFLMLKNSLKISIRSIKKHKGYSFINIFGLAAGMSCCLLILLWVQNELSYDRFHENVDSIYRVAGNSTSQPAPLGPALKDGYPEILNAVRFSNPNVSVRFQDKCFSENNFCFADPSVFEVFTFPFIQGDPQSALKDPYSVVITEETAQKYFGKKNPIGEVLKIQNKTDLHVTGIIQNIPSNSHIQFGFLGSFEMYSSPVGNHWCNHAYRTYIQLAKHVRAEHILAEISDLVMKNCKIVHKPIDLQPMGRIHLYEEGAITYVYIFSAIALFVLMIACINFMNLTTARSRNRIKEIGIKKVVGAYRSSLIKQFLLESLLFALVSLVLALIIIAVVLPYFNSFLETDLTFNILYNPFLVWGLIGITLITGLLSGTYPALFLSSFRPVRLLKSQVGSTSVSSKGSVFRKVLVVIQFAISITLIIGTLIIYSQMKYIRNMSLGFEKDQLIYISIKGDIQEKCDSFKNDLLKNPNIASVTHASSLPSYVGNTASGFSWEGMDANLKPYWQFVSTDFDYIPTLGLDIIDGRNFSREYSTDASEAIIINEKAAAIMEYESPIGKRFTLWGDSKKIIGVVKNFHFRPVHQQIEPLMIWIGSDAFKRYILVRLHPHSSNLQNTLAYIEKTWQIYAAGFPFEFHFLDEAFDQNYRDEQKFGEIAKYFTLFAILISCLGLFGLSAYMAEQRTKEVGIRKTLGATVPNIVLQFLKEYWVLIVLANVLAWPFAYLFMTKWLQSFAYRVHIGFLIFILSGTLALFIALLTVSFQAIKAATANPVDSLRYE